MLIKGCEGHGQGLVPGRSWRGQGGVLPGGRAGSSEKVTLQRDLRGPEGAAKSVPWTFWSGTSLACLKTRTPASRAWALQIRGRCWQKGHGSSERPVHAGPLDQVALFAF